MAQRKPESGLPRTVEAFDAWHAAQESRFVTLHTRTGPASFDESVHQEGTIALPAIGVTLALDEIYEDVTFEALTDDG